MLYNNEKNRISLRCGLFLIAPLLSSYAIKMDPNVFVTETKDVCLEVEQEEMKDSIDENTIDSYFDDNLTLSELVEGGCVDHHSNCSYWESFGECDINRGFMNQHCRKSCNFCDTTLSDSNELCLFWAENGECEKNPTYMHEVCKESCQIYESTPNESNICKDMSPKCQAWAEDGQCEKNVDYMLEYCKSSCGQCCNDEHESCSVWAEMGECKNNSDYMLEYCKKSCNVCSNYDMGVDQIVENEAVAEVIRAFTEYFEEIIMKKEEMARVRDMCKNNHELCAFWASVNECETNKEYMNHDCALSCRSCEQFDIFLRCPIDHKSADALQAGDLGKMFERISSDEFAKYKPNILSRPSKTVDDVSDVDKPWVVEFESFLTEEECDQLIRLGQQRGYKRSQVDAKKRKDGFFDSAVTDDRTSSNTWCIEECYNDPIVQKITNRIVNLTGVPETNMESFQLLQYEVGQYYMEHHDFNVYHMEGPRILTFFIYLNHVEEGGETRFNKLDITVTPKQGRAILWPSVLDSNLNAPETFTYHEALPVLKGVKYAANAWIHLNDFKTAHAIGCTG